MTDFLVLGMILLIVAAAGTYVYRAKKSGRRCIGCPDGGSCCTKKGEGHSCCCQSGKQH